MRISLYLPLLLPLLAARGLPGLGRRLAPSHAARALTVAAAAGGVGTLGGLALVAGAGLSHTPAVLEHSQLSPATLAVLDPVPRAVGALAAVLLVVALARLGHLLVRRARLTHQTRRVAEGAAAGELVVFTSPVPHAYAISGRWGRPGRIVVSDSMLRLLDAQERRVLLAHERAHLAHRHHRYRAVAAAAAAANPLLGRLQDQIGFALERWADEDAAGAVGNRRLTARSLAHAALATTATTSAAVLGFAEHEVTARVRALLTGPVASRPAAALPTMAVLVLGATALTDATYAFARVLTALLG